MKYRILAKYIGYASVAALSMLMLRVMVTGSQRYGFLAWNLFLAWVPLVLAFFIIKRRRDFVAGLLGVVWLLFMPNTFYIISDFIHLEATGEVTKLFDAVLFLSFTLVGLMLGYVSLYMIHKWMKGVIPKRYVPYIIATIIGLNGFAIYLGRYLRWNSWDIVFSPVGLIYDVTDRILFPINHPQTITTTLTFGLFIGAGYMLLYRAIEQLRHKK